MRPWATHQATKSRGSWFCCRTKCSRFWRCKAEQMCSSIATQDDSSIKHKGQTRMIADVVDLLTWGAINRESVTKGRNLRPLSAGSEEERTVRSTSAITDKKEKEREIWNAKQNHESEIEKSKLNLDRVWQHPNIEFLLHLRTNELLSLPTTIRKKQWTNEAKKDSKKAGPHCYSTIWIHRRALNPYMKPASWKRKQDILWKQMLTLMREGFKIRS